MTFAQAASPLNWNDHVKWLVGAFVGIIAAIWAGGTVYGGIVARLDNVVNNTAKIEAKVETAVSNQNLQHDLILGVQSKITTLETGVRDIGDKQNQVKIDLAKAQADTAEMVTNAATQARESAERRAINIPRIDALEASSRLTDKALAILSTKLEDIKGTGEDIKTIVKSHDKDIKATRNAVAPTIPH